MGIELGDRPANPPRRRSAGRTPKTIYCHRNSALGVVPALLVAILAFIVASWRRDRAAAWLFTPYAAWVAFASVLNGAVFVLN
ncbi:MAG: tryptophan-rich sensory protein [Alphaproteobacteria bacterium]|nr:tryptophan-rich sensory protein [Alphaproteobacteria bacterium]